MALKSAEINTYFGRCRCCLNYGYLKNMWEEHDWQGEKEVYVEMLVQCFALSWEHSEDSMEHDQICDSCVLRLRDAYSFKKSILESQDKLLGLNNEDMEVHVKIEKPDCSSQEGSDNEAAATSIYIDEPDDPDDPADPDYVEPEYLEDPDDPHDPDDPDDPEDPDDPDVSNEMEYEEVEYLDIEDNKEALAFQQNPQTVNTSARRMKSKKPPEIPPKGKWARKLPKSERYKTYKQYTEEDLRKCLEAVRNAELTAREAAVKFNIPKKTIVAKTKVLKDSNEQAESFDEKTVNREKMFLLIQELKTILTYTNATPYKSKANRYCCAYCTDGPILKDADELRTHTRSQHVTDRTMKLEYALRPHWMNETVKLDIENLICIVCCLPISNWNEMFKHLKERHKITLDQAYTRAIPYVLGNELNCALCKENFTNYMQLDGHMNAHYNNYMCDDCGDTFLAANRLKQHKKIHDVGKYPCDLCAKVFSLEKYRKKHTDLVHHQAPKFKCWYCEERFPGEYARHFHVREKHKEKVKIITCELCGKTFTWRPYYNTHMKKKHTEDPNKFKCEECNKKYFQLADLKEHMLRHTGVKHFPCKICNKRFISSGSLKHHHNWHKKQKDKSSVQSDNSPVNI